MKQKLEQLQQQLLKTMADNPAPDSQYHSNDVYMHTLGGLKVVGELLGFIKQREQEFEDAARMRFILSNAGQAPAQDSLSKTNGTWL